MDKIKLIKDQIHGNVLFSKIEADIFSSSIFNRLHNILQNSMAYLVYPTNKTSRFIHSVGVSKVASDIYLNGLKNSDNETMRDFFQSKKALLINIINHDVLREAVGTEIYSCKNDFFDNQNRLKLDSLIKPLNDIIGINFINHFSFSNDLFDDKSLLATNIILLQSLRLYALLHDFGHLPFSHLTEFSIEDIFNRLSDKENDRPPIYTKLEKISNMDDDIHEVVGKKLTYLLIEYLKFKDNSEITSLKCGKIIVYELFLNILKELHKGKDSKFYSIYEIVSSDLDADRIDYTLRDGLASFLIEKGADTDRIVKMYMLSKPNNSDSADEFKFLPAIQSLSDIDEFFIDRFRLYKVVINHHKVKKFDYILQKIIADTIFNEINKGISSDDDGEIASLTEMLDIIFELIDNKRTSLEYINDFFYRFSQLTDYWLLSLLKKNMISYLKKSSNGTDIEKKLLDELFAGSKNFKSLWKRDYEFKDFAIELAKKLEENSVFEDNLFAKPIFKELFGNIATLNLYEKGIKTIKFLYESFPNWLQAVETAFKDEEEYVLLVKSKLAKSPKKLMLVNINDAKLYSYEDVSTKSKALTDEADISILFFAYSMGDVVVTRSKLIEKTVEYIKKKQESVDV